MSFPVNPKNVSKSFSTSSKCQQPDTRYDEECSSQLDSSQFDTVSSSYSRSARAAQRIDSLQQPVSVPQRKLHVCLLGYRSAPYGGGQGVYLHYLSKALIEAGHQVDVISGQPYPYLDPRVRLIKMPGMNLFDRGLRSLRWHHLRSLTNIIEWLSKLTGGFAEPYCFGRRVRSYLMRHGRHYDIIHDNQSLSYPVLDLQRMGFNLVATIHHPITSDYRLALDAAESNSMRYLVKRWYSFLRMQKKVAKKLDYVVTVSERSRNDIARDFSVDVKKMRLVYNGIDTQLFRPIPEIKRKPYRVMATASADQPLKGLRFLLLALSKVTKVFPEVELLLVGKLREDGESAKLIKKLNLSQHIHYVSDISTEDMVRYYAQASVAVVPSLYEGFGLPAGEAMSCGVPVISSDGGALPEVVGDAGVIVSAGNEKALSEAIIEVLSDNKKQIEMAASGRRRIEKLFSWAGAAEQMLDLYREVMHADRRL